MMFQKFFINNYNSKFIKSLLRNTYIPKVSSISEGYEMIKGKCYFLNNHIVKCTQSGTFVNSELDEFSSNNGNTKAVDIAKYYEVREYIFGDDNPEISDNFVSVNSYYDSETHRRLGDYLRYYRDMYGIDLMSMYNCFGYEIATGFWYSESESSDGVARKFNIGTNDDYKLLLVPIKYNREYTIAVDCATPYYIYPVLYSDGGLIKTLSTEPVSKSILQMKDSGSQHITFSRFNSPYKYKLPCMPKDEVNKRPYDDYYNYENSLYLVLQLPSTNDSSVVVLEGDYTNTHRQIINGDSVDKISRNKLNRLLQSDVGLLQLNDKNIYAFSNKLMEYLLGNVIDSNEDINDNVSRIQNVVGVKNKKTSIDGIFDQNLRLRIYNNYMDSEYTRKIDVNGYVDRDTEEFIYSKDGMSRWQS